MSRHRQLTGLARYRHPALLGGLVGGVAALAVGSAALAFVMASGAGVQFSFSESARANIVDASHPAPSLTQDLATVSSPRPTPAAAPPAVPVHPTRPEATTSDEALGSAAASVAATQAAPAQAAPTQAAPAPAPTRTPLPSTAPAAVRPSASPSLTPSPVATPTESPSPVASATPDSHGDQGCRLFFICTG